MATYTMSEMRQYIMAQYPDNFNWHMRVRKMPTNQIVAIFYSMKDRAAKKKAKAIAEKKALEAKKNEPQYHQITMWEYMASLTENHTPIEIKE